MTKTVVGYDSEALTASGSVNVLTPSKYKDSTTSGGAIALLTSKDIC